MIQRNVGRSRIMEFDFLVKQIADFVDTSPLIFEKVFLNEQI